MEYDFPFVLSSILHDKFSLSSKCTVVWHGCYGKSCLLLMRKINYLSKAWWSFNHIILGELPPLWRLKYLVPQLMKYELPTAESLSESCPGPYLPGTICIQWLAWILRYKGPVPLSQFRILLKNHASCEVPIKLARTFVGTASQLSFSL